VAIVAAVMAGDRSGRDDHKMTSHFTWVLSLLLIVVVAAAGP